MLALLFFLNQFIFNLELIHFEFHKLLNLYNKDQFVWYKKNLEATTKKKCLHPFETKSRKYYVERKPSKSSKRWKILEIFLVAFLAQISFPNNRSRVLTSSSSYLIRFVYYLLCGCYSRTMSCRNSSFVISVYWSRTKVIYKDGIDIWLQIIVFRKQQK